MSSAMTPNALTDEQDLLCRRFYTEIVSNDAVWSGLTKTQRSVAGAVLQILGYSVAAGQIVPSGTDIKFRFGSEPTADEFVGLWDRDRMIVEGVLDDEAEDAPDADDTDEAGASESSESDEVGDVLLEDV